MRPVKNVENLICLRCKLSEIFEQIRELHRRDILFCPASGRQYTSLRKLFAPVAVYAYCNLHGLWTTKL